MERHNCSLESTKNIQEYLDFMEPDQDGLNEEFLLNKAIPDHLKSKILIHVTQSMVLVSDFSQIVR